MNSSKPLAKIVFQNFPKSFTDTRINIIPILQLQDIAPMQVSLQFGWRKNEVWSIFPQSK